MLSPFTSQARLDRVPRPVSRVPELGAVLAVSVVLWFRSVGVAFVVADANHSSLLCRCGASSCIRQDPTTREPSDVVHLQCGSSRCRLNHGTSGLTERLKHFASSSLREAVTGSPCCRNELQSFLQRSSRDANKTGDKRVRDDC